MRSDKGEAGGKTLLSISARTKASLTNCKYGNQRRWISPKEWVVHVFSFYFLEVTCSIVWTKWEKRLLTITASSRESSSPGYVIQQEAWKPEIQEPTSETCCAHCSNRLSQKTLSAPFYWLVLVSPRGMKCMVTSIEHSHFNIWTDQTNEPTKSLNNRAGIHSQFSHNNGTQAARFNICVYIYFEKRTW